MIEFNKPENLNGSELLLELKVGGIVVTSPPTIDGEGKFWLDLSESDKEKAMPIVAAHNGRTIAPNTAAEKQQILDQLGITAEQAKLLLS